VKAHQILEAGLGHMKDRSATYDKPAGERSMGATVDAFRAITGHDLTEEQGWLFMGLLKMVRSQQGGFRADNYEDLAAYAGLQGEAAWAERTNQDFGQQNTIDCRSAEQKGFNDPRTVVGVDVSFPTEKHMNFAPEQKAGAWVEWNGGPMPVAGTARVDIRTRDAGECFGVEAEEWLWGHSETGEDEGDIVAYRLSAEADHA